MKYLFHSAILIIAAISVTDSAFQYRKCPKTGGEMIGISGNTHSEILNMTIESCRNLEECYFFFPNDHSSMLKTVNITFRSEIDSNYLIDTTIGQQNEDGVMIFYGLKTITDRHSYYKLCGPRDTTLKCPIKKGEINTYSGRLLFNQNHGKSITAGPVIDMIHAVFSVTADGDSLFCIMVDIGLVYHPTTNAIGNGK